MRRQIGQGLPVRRRAHSAQETQWKHGKHATLAEILYMAGVHPDPVSALTLQFAIDNGIYTPKDCDPSFMDKPQVIEDPIEDPEHSPAKRVKLSTDSEFSVVDAPEGEHMREWLDIKNEPLDPNEIQVLLAASQE